MKRYVLQVIVHEGNDEFWDEINNKRETGCDKVLDQIRSEVVQWISEYGDVTLVEYTDKDNN